MVVVSSGAFGTPAILERSGIGSPDVLSKAGINHVVANIPGVGQEYQDHQLLIYPYKSNLDQEETMDCITNGSVDPIDLIKNNDNILGWNAQDVTCKLRPNDQDVAALGPKFEETWNKDYKNEPSRPLIMMSLVNCFPGDPKGIPKAQYFGVSVFTVYPLSRGHVHITGPELSDPLDFATGFFSDDQGADILKHRWAYKKQREVARRMHHCTGEVASWHPNNSKSSKAAFPDFNGPSSKVEDIEYSAEDDAAIDEWLRCHVGSAWHSLGTCKMAPLDQNGVVDQNLGVHGIHNLKLADLSIVPQNIAANTNHTALIIGEKAADIIIAELGLC